MEQTSNQELSQEIINKVINDQKLRIITTRENPLWFFGLYFSHFIRFKIAKFQQEIFKIIQDESNKQVVIAAFRGSAKSTLITTCYALWSIIGKPQKKFILIISQTQELAKHHLKNIRNELETNNLLRADLGPFQDDNEWSNGSLVLTNHGARIMAVSAEQGIRGIKHGPHRPDLIICDDIEDLNSTRTSESRDKTYEWFNCEIVPLGDIDTRIIVVGNILHEDSLVMRLMKEMQEGKRDGIYRKYPIIGENDEILWPGKYPDMDAIEKEKKKGDILSFEREFMLRIVRDKDAVIFGDDIKYYDGNPPEGHGNYNVIGTDFAISQESSADYTALVSAKIVGEYKDRKIYILPDPVNERMLPDESIDKVLSVAEDLGEVFSTRIYIESVCFQDLFIQQLGERACMAESVKLEGMSKRRRLELTRKWLRDNRILFPRNGAEELIKQLLSFPIERHDDLVDAFSLLVKQVISDTPVLSPVTVTLLRF